jgi:hypothetical protein
MTVFVSETIPASRIFLECSFFIFQFATLPPELWRDCIRWATLPPSGRLPLHDAPTTLDPWPVGMPHILLPYLQPEAAYGFEQSCLYPTKRALMLVSKAWAELAVEFMYESLVIGHFGVGRVEQVIAALEGSAGFLLKRWVKRVDIWDLVAMSYNLERLARIGLPNLRVQHTFLSRNLELAPSPILLSERPLHLVERGGSLGFGRLMSPGEVLENLRCLTLSISQPLPTPFFLPSNLRRFTIIVFETAHFRVQDFCSTRDSVALPNLTHLTVHHIDPASDRFMRSMELINRIGSQLRHLTLTSICDARDWTEVDFGAILRVCAQLTELVISPHMSTREADLSDYRHSNLQTLGITVSLGTSQPDYLSFFDIFLRREAFPRLSAIRLISMSTVQGGMGANRWLVLYALRLIGHGIRLEDHLGRLLPPVPVPENQN